MATTQCGRPGQFCICRFLSVFRVHIVGKPKKILGQLFGWPLTWKSGKRNFDEKVREILEKLSGKMKLFS